MMFTAAIMGMPVANTPFYYIVEVPQGVRCGGPSGVQGTSLRVVTWPTSITILTQSIGYRVGRVRLVFTLPKKTCDEFLPGVIAPGPLAYIEWFTAFTNPDPVHGMYRVTRCRGPEPGRARLASVVPVKNIRRSCHLFPVAPRGGIYPRDWTSSTVLDLCDSFWVSPFSDTHMYMTLI